MEIKTAILVETIPFEIYIESSFIGGKSVVIKYADLEPFIYCRLNYDYRYTSNSSINNAAIKIALSLGAIEPVKQVYSNLNFGNIKSDDKVYESYCPLTHALVPIEPTEDMILAGFESEPDRHFDGDNYPEEYDEMSGCQQAAFRAKRCYQAMIKKFKEQA